MRRRRFFFCMTTSLGRRTDGYGVGILFMVSTRLLDCRREGVTGLRHFFRKGCTRAAPLFQGRAYQGCATFSGRGVPGLRHFLLRSKHTIVFSPSNEAVPFGCSGCQYKFSMHCFHNQLPQLSRFNGPIFFYRHHLQNAKSIFTKNHQTCVKSFLKSF